jgi:endonuclease I
MITYFMYKQTMMQEFEVKDTTAGQSYVTCAYSGERKVFSGPFDWTPTNYSREHVFAHSWMPTNPANSPERPEYTDQFNLYPVNFPSVNAVRSNYPLGEVVTVTSSFLGGTYGQNADGQTVYEPRDEMKGDIARAMMYEAVSYNGTSGIWAFPDPISFIITYGQDQEVIKNWHFADLPDAYEIARNEYIYNLQGNRNPFIDSTDLVCFIDFSNMSYINGGCLAAIDELTNENVALYPNPAKDEVQMRSTDGTITGYTIVDLQGREVANVNSLNAAYNEIGSPLLLLVHKLFPRRSPLLLMTLFAADNMLPVER